MIALVIVQAGVIIVLLAMSGFFSSAETAFFSLNAVQIHRIGEKHPAIAQRIQAILTFPTRLLSTILIGNTLVNVCASVVGFSLIRSISPTHAEAKSVALMTSLLLVFGEIGPKRIAVLYPERISTYYAPVMERLIRWLTPARWLMDILTSGFQHLFHPTGRTLTEEEFEGVVEISGDEGILDKDEHQMVESILRLEDLQASDVMTPRLDMVGIDLNDPPTDLLKRIRQIKVRRVVLFRDQVDEVEGFLDTRQYLLDPRHDLMKAWLPPFYVPEAAPLDKLLAQFQRETKRAAIVVDEYGGTAGIVTRGDILEEITGEIGPEQEGHRLTIEPIGPNRWLVDGQVSLEDLNQELDLSLSGEGADRIAGWIMNQREQLPRIGDEVKAEGCRATVRRMRKHRIELVLLEKIAPEVSP